MANNCSMVEYTDALEEDEIELSLGLSIGGSLTKSKKSKPVEKELVRCSIDINTDLRESDTIFSGSSVSPVHFGDVVTDVMLDPQTKREIHALRRQEARKKREEKQQKKGICRARNGEYAKCGFENGDKRKFEAYREMRQNEDGVAEQVCKREKVGTQTIGYEYGETRKQSMNQNLELDPTAYTSSQQYPVVPMQYPYRPVQYVPFANGFAFPYVIPCWAPGARSNEKNVIQPVACRSFRPFNLSNGCNSEQNGGKDDGNGKPTSNGSPGCSSSAISEHRSSSLQGGSSSDNGSDSSHSKSGKAEQNASTGSDTQGYSSHSASSHPLESAQGIDKETNCTEKVVSSSIAKEEAASETKPDPINKAISKEMGKPPKPETQNHDIDTSYLGQMPCVSTTGNGPNGKTIMGFLYRYTKSEVSIVCVCHGSSFSPAEFVEHAGGIDVSHPLRHITVVL